MYIVVSSMLEQLYVVIGMISQNLYVERLLFFFHSAENLNSILL